MTSNVKDLAYQPGPGIFVDAHSFTLPVLSEVPAPLKTHPSPKDVAVMNVMVLVAVVNFLVATIGFVYGVVTGNFGPMLITVFPVAFTGTLAMLVANKKLGRAKYAENRAVLRARCDGIIADDGRGTLFGYVQNTDHFTDLIAQAMQPAPKLPKLETKPADPSGHTRKRAEKYYEFQQIADRNTAIHNEMERMEEENARIGAALDLVRDENRLLTAASHVDAMNSMTVETPTQAIDYLLHGAYLMLNHPRCSNQANRVLNDMIRTLDRQKVLAVAAEKIGDIARLNQIAVDVIAFGESLKTYAERVLT